MAENAEAEAEAEVNAEVEIAQTSSFNETSYADTSRHSH
jgi:hypothetical protein